MAMLLVDFAMLCVNIDCLMLFYPCTTATLLCGFRVSGFISEKTSFFGNSRFTFSVVFNMHIRPRMILVESPCSLVERSNHKSRSCRCKPQPRYI